MFSLFKKFGRATDATPAPAASTEGHPLLDPDAPCQWAGEHGGHDRRTYIAVTRQCCNALVATVPTCGLHADWLSENDFISSHETVCSQCQRVDRARASMI